MKQVTCPWTHSLDPLAKAAEFCEQQGTSIAKIAFQFSCQDSPFATTMFSSSRTTSVARNLAWYEEPLDQEMVKQVREILQPVMDKQWDYDAGIDRMND